MFEFRRGLNGFTFQMHWLTLIGFVAILLRFGRQAARHTNIRHMYIRHMGIRHMWAHIHAAHARSAHVTWTYGTCTFCTEIFGACIFATGTLPTCTFSTCTFGTWAHSAHGHSDAYVVIIHTQMAFDDVIRVANRFRDVWSPLPWLIYGNASYLVGMCALAV